MTRGCILGSKRWPYFAPKRRAFFQDGLRHLYSIRGVFEYLAFSIGYFGDLISCGAPLSWKEGRLVYGARSGGWFIESQWIVASLAWRAAGRVKSPVVRMGRVVRKVEMSRRSSFLLVELSQWLSCVSVYVHRNGGESPNWAS